jgi:hypothetical protein
MRRRPEAYHARLLAAARGDRRAGGKRRAASIHDAAAVHDADLVERLVYDTYERRSGLVHLLDPGTTRASFMAAKATELGDAHVGSYGFEGVRGDRVTLAREVAVPSRGGTAGVRIRKRFSIGRDRPAPDLELSVGIEHLRGPAVSIDLAIEWAINLLGGGNPAAWYEIDGVVSGHDAAGEHPSLGRIAAGNRLLGLEIATAFSPATTVWWGPIETISSSESGFEANYQGSALVAVWPMTLRPGDARVVTVKHRVTCQEASSGSPADDVTTT